MFNNLILSQTLMLTSILGILLHPVPACTLFLSTRLEWHPQHPFPEFLCPNDHEEKRQPWHTLVQWNNWGAQNESVDRWLDQNRCQTDLKHHPE